MVNLFELLLIALLPAVVAFHIGKGKPDVTEHFHVRDYSHDLVVQCHSVVRNGVEIDNKCTASKP